MPDDRPERAAPDPVQAMASKLVLACTREQKSRWIEAAKADGMKLAPWVVDRLDEAAGRGR